MQKREKIENNNFRIFKNIGGLQRIKNGCLILGGMPIGNQKDISVNMIETIPKVDLIVAENVDFFIEFSKRHNLSHTNKIIELRYNGTHTETFNIALEYLKDNKKVMLVSDCGMPTITDPGRELVNLAINNNIPIIALPGPNVAITAISMSGFQNEEFHYYGYLPKTFEEKNKVLKKSKKLPYTNVFLDSIDRTLETINIIDEIYGPKTQLFVGVNMTMINERLIYGNAEYAYQEVSKILKTIDDLWVVICIDNGFQPINNSPYRTSLN